MIMYLFLATVIGTAGATAQITTSKWMLGDPTFPRYFGSIIEQSGDRTTLRVEPDIPANVTETTDVRTVTLQGSTYWRGSDIYENTENSDGPVTLFVECSREGDATIPTCAITKTGFEEGVEKVCELWSNGGTTFTRSYTWTSDANGPAGTQTITYDYASTNIPKYCTGSVRTPSWYLPRTFTASYNDEYISQYQMHEVVITAGIEKLDASAAASPTTNGAKVTGSGSGINGISGPSQNSVVMASQQTGVAAPAKTLSPALAGLGAAAVAYFF